MSKFFIVSAYQSGLSELDNLKNSLRVVKDFQGFVSGEVEGIYKGKQDSIFLSSFILSSRNMTEAIALRYNQECYLEVDNGVCYFVDSKGQSTFQGFWSEIRKESLNRYEGYAKVGERFFTITKLPLVKGGSTVLRSQCCISE